MILVLKDLLIVAFYIFGCMCCGSLFLNSLGSTIFAPNFTNLKIWERYNSFFALGLAGMTLIWTVVGLFGFLSSKVIIVTTLILIIGKAILFQFAHEKNVFKNKTQKSPLDFKNILIHFPFCFLLLIVLLWHALLAYFSPVRGDAEAFYFTYAKIISHLNKLVAMPGPYYAFSSIGVFAELHFAVLMKLATPEAAKLLCWVCGVSSILFTASIIRSLGGNTMAGLFAFTILLTSTTFTDYLSDGKTEMFSTCLALFAIAFYFWASAGSFSLKELAVLGISASLACVAKISLLITLIPQILSLIIYKCFTEKSKSFPCFFKCLLKNCSFFLICVLIGFLPHILKNKVLFGAPFAPFFGIGGFVAEQSWFNQRDTFWILLTYPLALTYGSYPMMGGNLSFLWLAVLPLLLVFKKDLFQKSENTKALFVTSSIGLGCWLLIKPSVFAPRYILPVLFGYIILASLAYEKAWDRNKIFRVVPYTLCILMGITLWGSLFNPPAGYFTLTPKNLFDYAFDKNNKCKLNINSYRSGFELLNLQAPPASKILLAGYYGYYLRPDLLVNIGDPKDLNLIEMNNSTNFDSLIKLGYKFIIIQRATHEKYLKYFSAFTMPSNKNIKVILHSSDMVIFQL